MELRKGIQYYQKRTSALPFLEREHQYYHSWKESISTTILGNYSIIFVEKNIQYYLSWELYYYLENYTTTLVNYTTILGNYATILVNYSTSGSRYKNDSPNGLLWPKTQSIPLKLVQPPRRQTCCH